MHIIQPGNGAIETRRETAVEQFDKFLRERTDSERSAMLLLGQSNNDGPLSAESSLEVCPKQLYFEKLILRKKKRRA